MYHICWSSKSLWYCWSEHIKKLEHYRVRRISSKWFESNSTDRKQPVSIDGFNSNISTITSGVPQGSVWGTSLFLVYINHLNLVIKHCKVHHFADEKNILNINKSPKHLNKPINIDLKNLTEWINANKVSLNFSKKKKKEQIPKRKYGIQSYNKLNGKRLYESNLVKYPGIGIENKLNCKAHIDEIALKLIRANVMLYKVTDLINAVIL